MPVSRVPVIHKFGIISPSHRLELQERLVQRTQFLKANNERLIRASKNPLEVTEDFILAYNASSHDLKRREKLDDKADKILEKLKRQVGLKTSGVGNHVDIPIAWTDLTQLSQCKGRVQQECLDVLLVSLDQSPTSSENIPVLFFLAESVLYSLRTDVIYEPFLGSSEVKLFFIGQRVFARLFFHHMCGEMIEFVELKRRLHTYLDGFLDSQKVYKPYPHILSCLRYMSSVGSIVIGDIDDDDAGKEQEEETQKQTTSNNPPVKSLQWGDNQPQPSVSRTSTALISSVHELAPTLWHSLDVWRCVCSLGGGLSEALRTMRDCAVDLAMENWVDVICALDVLGDAARSNLETLTALQRIACGIRDEPQSLASQGDTDMEDRDLTTHVDPMTDSRYVTPRLPAIAESEASVRNKDGLVGEVGHRDQDPAFHEADWTNSRSEGGAFSSKLDRSDQLETSVRKAERDWTISKSVGGAFSGEGRDSSERTGATRFAEKLDVQNLTNDFDSNSSSLLSNQMAAENAVVGLVSWRWELAVKYIDVLGHIVLCGSTSFIRRQALMGANDVADYIHQTASIVRSPLASAGLFDLLFFRAATHEKTGKGGVGQHSDWGWRVRFATFLRLYQIHACLSRDQTTLGIRTVIWNIVERAEQLERDVRVLEALKVAQVDTNLENLLHDHLTSSATPSNLGAKIAQGLMTIYLPPLPPPSSGSRPQTMRHAHGAFTSKSEAPNEMGGRTQRLHQPLRTSLRDEITLSNLLYQPTASFEKRTTKRLNYVIEDQWRKELERLATEEQEAKLKEHNEKEKSARVKNKSS